jgi:hypothetical protein
MRPGFPRGQWASERPDPPHPAVHPGRPERRVSAALAPFGCPWVIESNRPFSVIQRRVLERLFLVESRCGAVAVG